MSSPATLLLASVDLTPDGTVTWGERIPSILPGVYVIETPAPLPEAPLDSRAIAAWITRVPNLRLDGRRPTPDQLADRLREFWIPDEPIIYIGLAGTNLRTRVGQFYRTPLGNRAPHAGGHWLKTLTGLAAFRISWAETDDPSRMEDELLVAFADRLSAAARARLPDGPVLPFANLETAAKTRKIHGISGATLPRVKKVSKVVGEPDSQPATRSSRRGNIGEINAALQRFACARPEQAIAAVEGARELDRLGLLPDSPTRPGKPLRELLRAGAIDNANQDDGRFWFIRCAGLPE